MDNKLSELKDALEFLETTEFDGEWDSALVGGENGKNYHAVINANDVVVRADDDSRHTSWLCDYLEAVSPVNIRALLAELEAKDKRIAELEAEITNIVDSHAETVAELRAKLATPVRLQSPWVDKVGNRWLLEGTTADVIRAAGFAVTVEGGE
ncbi:TPA: ead/Ea22-like family protein [Serratia marcescens]|nr:ead/Ea22-like family protein [Serratia marcescens]